MPKGMTPLRCDLCGGPLVMDISGEFAACEYCSTKYMRDYLQQKISGSVSIQGNVATRPADFTILAGVLQKYSGESIDVVIPDNVTKIADGAFKGMGIRSVVIPDSVTHIGKDAFASTQLKELVIPDSVVKIDDGAFSHSELRSVQLSNSLKEIGQFVFLGTKLKELVIPDSVVEIGYVAFKHSELQSVQLSNSLKEIGYFVFSGTKLEELVIPDSVDYIDETAFRDCSSLRKVVLPQNKILKFYRHGEGKNPTPFYGCWKLDTIENSEKYGIAYFEGTSMWARRKGLCRHCGNKFNLITKKCTKCGHPKDY